MKRLGILVLMVLMAFSVSGCTGSTGGGTSGQEALSANTEEETAAEETAGGTEEAATIQETVLLEDSGVKITATALDEEAFMGPELKVKIENTSGRNLTVQCRDVSVNGFMVDPIFSCDIVDGKTAMDSITFMSSELEEAGIETIDSIELSFHIYDSDSWDDYLNTGVVTITRSAS